MLSSSYIVSALTGKNSDNLTKSINSTLLKQNNSTDSQKTQFLKSTSTRDKKLNVVAVTITRGSSFPDNGKFYEPANITLQGNTTVNWINNDTVIHTVTSGNPINGTTKLFDSGFIQPNKSFNFTFSKPSVVEYFCTIHPFMTGKISVIKQIKIQKEIVPPEELPLSKNITISKGSSFPNNGKFYLPSEFAIAVNGTAKWTNEDSVVHTVTSGYPRKGPSGYFDSGLINSSSMYNHTFAESGIYDYYCTLHPYMTGKVIVGYYTYNFNASNQNYPISYQITGNGNEVKRISLQPTAPVLEVRLTSQTPGNLTLVVPRNVLDRIDQNDKDDIFGVTGNRPVGFNETSTSPASRTLKIQFDSGLNYIQIIGSRTEIPSLLQNRSVTNSVQAANNFTSQLVQNNASSIQKIGIKISIPSTWKVSDVDGTPILPGFLVSPLNDGNTSMYVTAFSDPTGQSIISDQTASIFNKNYYTDPTQSIISDPIGLSTFVDWDIQNLRNSDFGTIYNVKKVDTTVSGNKAITVKFIFKDATVQGYSPAHQKTFVQHDDRAYVFDYVSDNPASYAKYLRDIENMMESVKFDSRIPENNAASGQTISNIEVPLQNNSASHSTMEENDINAFTNTNVTVPSSDYGSTTEEVDNNVTSSENGGNTNLPSESAMISIVQGASSPDMGKGFEPASITVSKGTIVTWTNDDTTLHTVTSGSAERGDSGIVFDSSYLAAGKIFSHKFVTAGTFDYYCTLHPYMQGNIEVY